MLSASMHPCVPRHWKVLRHSAVDASRSALPTQALTAGSRKAMATNPKEDPTATTVIRLTNRLVASTLMYFIPIVIFVQNMHR